MLDFNATLTTPVRPIDLRPEQQAECWFGVAQTPVGPAVLVAHQQTLLALWLDSTDSAPVLRAVLERFHCHVTQRDDQKAAALVQQAFAGDGSALSLGVAGSDFDVQVWRALVRIPRGQRCSYGELAMALGRPGAARAVGGALSRNLIAYLIPCHRVVRQSGDIGEFRWGRDTKMALLAWEQAVSND